MRAFTEASLQSIFITMIWYFCFQFVITTVRGSHSVAKSRTKRCDRGRNRNLDAYVYMYCVYAEVGDKQTTPPGEGVRWTYRVLLYRGVEYRVA